MSPVSTDGSEWSGINQYSLPSPNSVRGFPTPPQSGAAHSSHNGPSDTTSVSSNSLTLPPSGRMSQKASPPSSVTSPSRVSDGTLSDQSNARRQRMEDMLSQHYIVLRRYLQGPSREESNIRSNRARDKLLRLSPVLFLELSTDVYDELLRRQAVVAASRPGPPRPEVPPHLLPRQEYHKKRNQARQKLSSLQDQRFKDLATDVFCELERRFPHFAGPEMNRRASPAPSMGGRFGGPRPDSNGQGYGYPGTPNGSRGPPPGPRGPGYHSGPGPGNRFPPRQGSLGAISATGLGINSEGMPDNSPYQKSFQNNTVVPNKSTMVEDDDADDDDDRRSDAFALDKVLDHRRDLMTGAGSAERDKKLADAEAQVSELQKKVKELELMHKEKEEEVNTLRKSNDSSSSWKAEKAEYEELKRELEEQLSNTHNLNNAVLSQLEEARDRQKDAEMELEKLRQEQQSVDDIASGSRSHGGDDDWKSRFEDLDREHESLKAKLKQQQEVTEQVRQQAAAFLQEMRALSDGHSSNWDREERLIRDVHRLEAEVKHWKNRYAKSKTQLRHLRSSSIGLPDNIHDANTIAKDNALTQPDGLVKDVHITKFQMAIDELLRIARSDEPSLVLGQMKGVVLAVRYITQDIDSAVNVNTATDDELTKIRARAKAQVSATANNLITASKNFGNSNGLSPVSLLDAAASHLTAAIVELVRKVKIRPTPEDELADEGEEDQLPPMQSPEYFSVAPSLTRFSGNESIYSAISSPPSLRSRTNSHSMSRNRLSGAKHGYPGLSPDKDLEELRLHLEDQTSSLVHSIQSLVASIRGEDSVSAIQLHINTIADAVEKVVTSTETAMAKPNANPALRDRAVPVVEILARHRDSLLDIRTEVSKLTDGTEIRELNSRLPPIAFQIARETKELVQRIDQIEYASQNSEEDDFR